MAFEVMEDGVSKVSFAISLDTTVGDVMENAAGALETLARVIPASFELRMLGESRKGNSAYSCALAMCECLEIDLHAMAQRVCAISDALEDEISGMAGISDEKVASLYGLARLTDDYADREAAKGEGADND